MKQSADIAVIVGESTQNCDSTFINSIASQRTIAAIARECIIGYFGLGHAIAAMFGAYPNREMLLTNPVYPQAHGFLMNPPKKSGFRTIMA